MTKVRTLLRSFSGGELSPELRGRLLDVRYQTGARTMLNFQPSPRGPARKRRGFAHVDRSPGDARMELVPFRFSGDQNLAVGVGAGFFRFFAEGAPLLFAQARTVEEIDVAADTLRFLDPHGFTPGESVRVLALDSGGAEPSPTDDVTGYTVTVVDAWTINLSAVNFTDAGTGTIRLVPTAQMPPTYVASQQATGINLAADTIAFAAAHNLASGDPVVFTTGNRLPGPLVQGTVYYAIYYSASEIKVATTAANALAGTAIDLYGWPVTFDGVSDEVQWLLHPLQMDGLLVTFAGGTMPPELSGGVTYYVLNHGLNSFQVGTSYPGSPINFSNGTGEACPVDLRVHYAYEEGDQVYYRGVGKGFWQCKIRDPRDNPPPSTTYWHHLPDDGHLEAPNDFTGAQILELDYAQTGDVLTFTHGDIDQRELTRLSATQWKFGVASVTPPIAAPTGVSVTGDGGQYFDFTWGGPPLGRLLVTLPTGTDATGVGFVEGSYIKVESTDSYSSGSFSANPLSGEFVVSRKNGTDEQFELAPPKAGSTPLAVASYTAAGSGPRRVRMITALGKDETCSYKVTAVTELGVESEPSAAASVTNNLFAPGASNTISWSAVAGAKRYRVYRLLNGLYGWIGDSETTTFRDEVLEVQLDESLPEIDTTLAAGHPEAVANHDQRRWLAGPVSDPTRFVGSRVGHDSDFSRHIPLQADDRISLRVAKDGSRILHMLSTRPGLLLLSSGGESLATAYGEQALGPEATGVFGLSEVGCSQVMPVLLNGRAMFVALRGGHVYEVAPERPEAPTVDVSVRANHLVDGFTIGQLTTMQHPWPTLCAVRGDGRLLVMSQLPHEDVLGWAQFVTNGNIESACGLPDGAGDALYVLIERNGVRSVQRMLAEVYLDDAVLWDGRNTGAVTVSLAGGIAWDVSDLLTITTSAVLPLAVGDFVDVYTDTWNDDGTTTRTTVRITISEVVDGLNVRGRPDGPVPAALRSTAVTTWEIGKKRVRTPHASAALVARPDGGPTVAVTSDADGFVELATPAILFQVGRAYTALLETLPLALPQDLGGGKGITWNLNRVFAAVSGGAFAVGPRADRLVVVEPDEDEERVMLPGQWSEDGGLLLRSTEPVPCEVRYLALEVAAS